MGQEFGQEREWSEARELDWFLLENPLNKGMQDYVKELLKLYTSNPAMYENDNNWDGFEWINCNDNDRSIYSFVRKTADGSKDVMGPDMSYDALIYKKDIWSYKEDVKVKNKKEKKSKK